MHKPSQRGSFELPMIGHVDSFVGGGVVYQLDSSPDVTDASFDSPDQQWTAQDVYHAIDQIMPAHREILVLRYLQHFDYSEIADILGCPLGTVGSRLFHAKKALREVFESEQNP